MERLTNKKIGIVVKGTISEEVKERALIYEKLQQLENIEEKLGIDLITLGKALKEGIWFSFKNMNSEHFGVKYKNKKHHIIPKLKVYQNDVGAINWYLEIAHENWSYNYFLYPEYYGKTWWLEKPKEELENE